MLNKALLEAMKQAAEARSAMSALSKDAPAADVTACENRIREADTAYYKGNHGGTIDHGPG